MLYVYLKVNLKIEINTYGLGKLIAQQLWLAQKIQTTFIQMFKSLDFILSGKKTKG